MCFSATASFVTAGITGAIGVVAVARTKEPSELLLAGAPLFFAVQQGVEGLLWLVLSQTPEGPAVSGLALTFLIFAEVLWPVYAPMAVLLIEPDEKRRLLVGACLAVGVALSAYLLRTILTQPYGAAIQQDHIVYLTDYRHSDLIGLAYLAATGLPLVLSSWRTVEVLGAIILVGCVVAYVLYWEAFVSVWCFFAAAASVVILTHFEYSRRRRLRSAGV